MPIPPDKRKHLIYGSGVALFLLALLLIAPRIGLGMTVAIGSTVIGWAVERYQAIRREGTPDNMDWLATSLPGVLLGAAVDAWTRFH